jgi:hypothetical protein
MSKQQSQQPQQQPTIPGASQKDEVIEQLTDTGINRPAAESVADLLSEDYVLSNIQNADREYARLLAKNIVHYVRNQHPPLDSHLQGISRMALTGNLQDGKTGLTREQQTQLESVLLGMFFRVSRSIDGWQQDKLTECIQTRRVEDNRQPNDSEGPLGGIFS